MAEKILPVFQGLGDPEASAALSRPLLAPYKVEYIEMDGDEFPPEAAVVVAGVAAYLEQGRLRRKLAVPLDDRETIEQFVGQYDSVVGGAQRRAEIIARLGLPLELGGMAIQLAQEASEPAVGAFYLLRSRRSPHTFYSGLMIPGHTYEAAPERLMASADQMIAERVQQGDSRGDAEAAHAALRELLTAPGLRSEGMGFAAASLSLPPPDWMRQTLLTPRRQ